MISKGPRSGSFVFTFPEGLSATDTFAILAGYILILAWIIWLVVVAWRTKESVRAPTR